MWKTIKALAALFVVCVSGYSLGPAARSLRCELLGDSDHLEILTNTPRFSWQLLSGVMQSGYRVQVCMASESFDSGLLAFDSGMVEAGDSVAVELDGLELIPGEAYHWRVKVWNDDLVECHWSESQRFVIAEPEDIPVSRYPLTESIIRPVLVEEKSPGHFFIDFGKVAFGYLELQLNASTEGVIAVHFGERGDASGVMRELPKKSSVRYYQVDQSVVKGRGNYGVHPSRDERNTRKHAIPIPGRFGTIAPFRYVEIEANGVDLDSIIANQVAVHYPFDEYESSFESSNEALDAIWDLCKYSMKATTFAGVYVDGDRERIPYEADSYINMLSHYAVDSEYSIGRYTHEYLMDYETWPTEWKQHSVMLAWADWMYTGDSSSVARTYDRLKETKILEYMAREDGLLVSLPYERSGIPADIVDWPPVERDGYVFKEVNTVVNSFRFLNLNQMADMAEVLGKEDEAQEYRETAVTVRRRFNELLFDETTGLYVDGVGTNHSSFHANLFPLAFGLVPQEHVEKVVDFVVSKDLSCSVYAAQYLLEALYLSGREDAALRLMTMSGKRSWQNMLAVGSTITLEAWDDSFKPNQDWNHAWGGAPGNAIARYLLGVRPIEAGFSKILVAPRIGHLESVSGKVPTIRGPVSVEMKQSVDRELYARICLPGNSVGMVSLPIPEGMVIDSLLLNGKEHDYQMVLSAAVIDDLNTGEYEFKLMFR